MEKKDVADFYAVVVRKLFLCRAARTPRAGFISAIRAVWNTDLSRDTGLCSYPAHLPQDPPGRFHLFFCHFQGIHLLLNILWPPVEYITTIIYFVNWF